MKKLIFLFIFLNFLLFNLLNCRDCGKESCNDQSSICSSENICICINDYTTFPLEDEIKCNYKQKRANTALLLEIIFPFGISHYYRGDFYLGTAKLIFASVTVFLIFYLRFVDSKREEGNPLTLKIALISCLFSFAMFLWIVIDIFMYWLLKYKDSNGADLLEN